jgi:hypothetical protein
MFRFALRVEFTTDSMNPCSSVRRLSCPHLSKLAASFLESAQLRQTFDCELYRADTRQLLQLPKPLPPSYDLTNGSFGVCSCYA